MVGTKREFQFLLIFALGLCFFASAYSQSQLEIAKYKRDFDYFWFVQEWRPSICESLPLGIGNCVGTNRFAIYGLWPEFENGNYPLNCTGPPFEVNLIKNDLFESLWIDWPGTTGYPSTKYWKDAWDMHGVCSYKSFTQTKYFEKAITLLQNFDINLILSRVGIKPTSNVVYYRKDTVKNVIAAFTGKTPGLRCKKNPKTGQAMFTRVIMCYERDGQTLRDCPNSADKGCPYVFIWPDMNFHSGLAMSTDDH